jgi:hypothetical protein
MPLALAFRGEARGHEMPSNGFNDSCPSCNSTGFQEGILWRDCHSLEDFSRTLSCSARGGVRSVISKLEPSLYDEMSKIGQRFQNGANH